MLRLGIIRGPPLLVFETLCAALHPIAHHWAQDLHRRRRRVVNVDIYAELWRSAIVGHPSEIFRVEAAA